jgi:DNA-binding MarR family transcriptional regulator
MSSHFADDNPAIAGQMLGARLRRLSERIDREAEQIYESLGIQFEQRWYGVLARLAAEGPLSVGELAGQLGISHAAISQTRAALMAAGVVVASADQADGRRRILSLTTEGESLVRRLEPVWRALNAASSALDDETDGVAAALGRLDVALDRKGLRARFEEASAGSADVDAVRRTATPPKGRSPR